MSDLRALIRLKEKDLRRLEWGLMSQKVQESAAAYVPESLKEEMEDCKTEQQVGHDSSFFFNSSNNTKSRWNEQAGAGLWSTVADPFQIWVSHMGNHTSTKAESLQAKRDILVPQGLLPSCPVAAAQIHHTPHHWPMRKSWAATLGYHSFQSIEWFQSWFLLFPNIHFEWFRRTTHVVHHYDWPYRLLQ